MKNAAKTCLATIAACVGVGMGLAAFSVETVAATNIAMPSSPSAAVALPTGASIVPPAAALPSPVTTTPSVASPVTTTPTEGAPAAAVAVPGISVAGSAGSTDKADDKVPESVKDIVKKLSKGTENATVEDLNEARQAVAKLDLLLDIEKRLKDLTTVRAEREEKASGASLANAIPASALGMKGKMGVPTPMLMSQLNALGQSGKPGSAEALAAMMPPTSNKVEVDRVVGSRGRYVAFLRVGEDKVKQYKVGEKLSDGRVIQSISSHGITLANKKKVETIKVHDVSAVFGAP